MTVRVLAAIKAAQFVYRFLLLLIIIQFLIESSWISNMLVGVLWGLEYSGQVTRIKKAKAEAEKHH